VHVKKEISHVKNGEWVAPPATYKLPQGYYASVTEANLVNYPGMAFQANGANGLVIRLPQHQRPSYPYRLRYSPEDTLRLHQPAVIAGTIITPWRVVIIGSNLNTMVNSDIIPNLCPPPDKSLFPEGLHTAWIKPGRAVWKYLDGGGEGTVDVLKKFTDEAAELGFEHNILEGFWARWGGDTLKQFIDYSREKKVGIWLWKHSKSLHNAADRQAFFKRCHNLGVTGLKIDFFDHEAKEVIDLYTAILREAAQNHLLLDFHGANKPTGLARTWPNLLTCEAVKGMESSRLVDRATHETTIPFTRCLAGPAEYTVLMFTDRRKNTTWAHQIASAAILSGPLLTYAANPASILSNPAVEVIKHIPAVWDETIVLPGSEIGELAAYARRKGNNWFVAVMNGTTPKKITIPLKFLKTGTYAATIVKDDGDNSASVVIEHNNYSAKNSIELNLVAGGGYIAEFVKTN
jgi:alpha-glucosidase